MTLCSSVFLLSYLLIGSLVLVLLLRAVQQFMRCLK